MKENNQTIEIEINNKKVIRNLLIFCICFEIFLVLLDAFINYGKYTEIGAIRRLCNIAREDSLASWFGTTQTFMVGLTLWLIVLVVKYTPSPKKIISGWCVIAVFFTYMAVDDGAEIHERMGSAFEAIAEDSSSIWMGKLIDIFPSYEWQMLFLPFFGAMGLFMLIFLYYELNQKTARILMFCGIACFVTAVGLDFIEGLDEEHKWNIHTLIREAYSLDDYTVRHFAKSLEEFIEMLGTTLFWIAFTNHLSLLMKNGIRFFSHYEVPASLDKP